MHIFRPDGEPRAVVLVAHGLNQRAFALRPLAESLCARGAVAVLIRFRGHRVDDEDDQATLDAWRAVGWEQWREDWEEGAEAAARLAEHHAVPLTFLGFSLGALVHVHALAHRPEPVPRFERQVLLAPAIRVRRGGRAVLTFRALGRGFLVPTFSPADGRSHRGTSIAAYEALFRIEQSLDDVPDPTRLRIPTLALIDPRDELVSLARLQEWIAEHGLASHWRIEVPLRHGAPPFGEFRHDLTRVAALGREPFDALADTVAKELLSPPSIVAGRVAAHEARAP